jgi:hypothetical protein
MPLDVLVIDRTTTFFDRLTLAAGSRPDFDPFSGVVAGHGHP